MSDDGFTISSYCLETWDRLLTVDPRGNPFYHVCILGRFAKDACPRYLTPEGFAILKSGNIRNLELRLATLSDALEAGPKVTRMVLMDHMDWLDETQVSNFAKVLKLNLPKDALCIWRSAGLVPWMSKTLADEAGMEVRRISDGASTVVMDRVNMYKSFWIGKTKE